MFYLITNHKLALLIRKNDLFYYINELIYLKGFGTECVSRAIVRKKNCGHYHLLTHSFPTERVNWGQWVKKHLKSFGNSKTTVQNETDFAASNIFKLIVNICIEQRNMDLEKNPAYLI